MLYCFILTNDDIEWLWLHYNIAELVDGKSTLLPYVWLYAILWTVLSDYVMKEVHIAIAKRTCFHFNCLMSWRLKNSSLLRYCTLCFSSSDSFRVSLCSALKIHLTCHFATHTCIHEHAISYIEWLEDSSTILTSTWFKVMHKQKEVLEADTILSGKNIIGSVKSTSACR